MSIVTVENLELSQIVPSTTNPRKSFDQVALEQLAESIKEIGITVPILVRPIPFTPGEDDKQWYELVSGHRRLRAAAIAGLDTIPSFVRAMDDATALDIQMVENLQRADLHPMDEAAGYQALIDAAADRGVALTQDELAHKVGKPLSYVAQRVKLLDATPIVQKTFSDGLINIGHALVLARLQPEMQEKGLRQVFDPNGYRGKDKTTEELIEHLLEGTRPDPEFPADAEENQDLVSIDTLASPVSRLKQWVEEKVTLSLANAPWNLTDERLYEEAGSCIKCPKRTGSNPALFAEMTTAHDSCTDPDCFAQKKKLFVAITLKAAEKQGEPLPKLVHTWSHAKLEGDEKVIKQGQWVEVFAGEECPDTKKALMTKGPEAGSIFTVCCNQKCKTHKHQVQSASRASSGGGESWEDRQKRENAGKKLYMERETPIRVAVFEAIRAQVKPDVDCLRAYVLENLNGPLAAICDRNGWPVKASKEVWARNKLAESVVKAKVSTLSIEELLLLLFDMQFLDELMPNDWRWDEQKADRKDILELAKKYGVDFAAIEKQVTKANPAVYEDKPAEPEKAKSTPKKAAKKAVKKTAAKKAVKASGKSAAANDFTDDEVDTLATKLADTACEHCENPECTGDCVDDSGSWEPEEDEEDGE